LNDGVTKKVHFDVKFSKYLLIW